MNVRPRLSRRPGRPSPSSLSRRVAGLALGALIAVAALGSGVGQAQQPAAAPDPTDANITRMTTGILGHSQFAHHPLDAELAGKLLDLYLDALDGNRSLFLKS